MIFSLLFFEISFPFFLLRRESIIPHIIIGHKKSRASLLSSIHPFDDDDKTTRRRDEKKGDADGRI